MGDRKTGCEHVGCEGAIYCVRSAWARVAGASALVPIGGREGGRYWGSGELERKVNVVNILETFIL